MKEHFCLLLKAKTPAGVACIYFMLLLLCLPEGGPSLLGWSTGGTSNMRNLKAKVLVANAKGGAKRLGCKIRSFTIKFQKLFKGKK